MECQVYSFFWIEMKLYIHVHIVANRISCVMISMLALSTKNRGFEPWSR